MNSYSIDDVESALSAVDDVVVGDNHVDAEIISAEKTLLVKLPKSFKEYLKRWGNISLGPIEYYGLTKNSNFKDTGVPNFVWFTLKKREEVGLPTNLIVFQNGNDEVYYCLDTNSFSENDECKIVRWDNIDRVVDQVMNVNFFGYMLGDIEEYID